MTEKRKDGKKDKKIPVATIQKAVEDSYIKAIPDLPKYTGVRLLRGAVSSLREYIEKGEKGISWKNPFGRLEYVVTLSEDGRPRPIPITKPCKIEDAEVSAEDAPKLTDYLSKAFLKSLEVSFMSLVTKGVILFLKEGIRDGKPYDCEVHIPPDSDLQKELDALPEDERNNRVDKLVEGYSDFSSNTEIVKGTIPTESGPQDYRVNLIFRILPLTFDPKRDRAFFSIHAGLDFVEGDPTAWPAELRAELWTRLQGLVDDLAASFVQKQESSAGFKSSTEAYGTVSPAMPDRVTPVRPKDFAVAGSYVRPIFGLAERKQDFPLLLQFYEPQTPLNWAVGLAMFSLTDEDRVRDQDWQEATIHDLEDRVFCLTEREAPRRGDQGTDILAEVVKLHTTRNWYYEVDTVQVGRAWKKRAIIGSQYAMPELQLVFIDKKTGKRAFPTDPAVRTFQIPLEVKGRRIMKPDGKDIPALPRDRWKLEAIRWRWVQAFNDDLLVIPAMETEGRRKGLPKKTTRGKTIRKGYQIRVAQNVMTALQRLRSEGRGSLYAFRLLLMLAHNINKTENGIAADRIFRMLGIPEDYMKTAHEKPEDLVARAVYRLKQRDIMALLPGSDEYPRTDPNPERRTSPYYCFFRSPNYTPRTGLASKETALEVEAEYAKENPIDAPETPPGPKVDQAFLPGMEAPSDLPIPSGSDIRAAREAAGMNLRDFARMVKGPAFKTWSNYENGKPIRVPSEVWQRVREFVSKHGKGDL